MERIWHHNKPPKRGPPTKTHGQGKKVINQRGNKETKDNPEGQLGFTIEWAEKSHCLKKKISKHVWCSPKGMWETPKHMEVGSLVR